MLWSLTTPCLIKSSVVLVCSFTFFSNFSSLCHQYSLYVSHQYMCISACASLQEQQAKLLNRSWQIVPASLWFGLPWFFLNCTCQLINTISDAFGVNVGLLGFTALDLTVYSKSKSLFFLNLKQNLYIFYFFVKNTVAEVLRSKGALNWINSTGFRLNWQFFPLFS